MLGALLRRRNSSLTSSLATSIPAPTKVTFQNVGAVIGVRLDPSPSLSHSIPRFARSVSWMTSPNWTVPVQPKSQSKPSSSSPLVIR
jgi:hypothetical protein